MIILRDKNNAPLATRSKQVAIFGGQPGNPITPSVRTAITGATVAFTVDHQRRYAYDIHSGNLVRADLTAAAPAWTQLLAQSAIGTTITQMDMPPDDSCLYVITSTQTVLKILTAAPYTLSLVAGGGSGTAPVPGTGAAVVFGDLVAICVDIVDGSSLFVGDNASAIQNVWKVTCPTGASTLWGTPNNSFFNQLYPFSMTADQEICKQNVLRSPTQYSSAFTGSGNWQSPLCVDATRPSAAFIYLVDQGANAAALLRFTAAPVGSSTNVTSTGVAVLTLVANAFQVGSPMFFRSTSLFVLDTAGNLLQIHG
jgi:hypothetical protein